MPKVGTRTFPYTSSGAQQAQKHARATGQKMTMKKGGKVKKSYRRGGIIKGIYDVNMNLLKDLWGHIKEWNEWKMKDWIKAGIVVIVVLVVLKIIIVPGA